MANSYILDLSLNNLPAIKYDKKGQFHYEIASFGKKKFHSLPCDDQEWVLINRFQHPHLLDPSEVVKEKDQVMIQDADIFESNGYSNRDHLLIQQLISVLAALQERGIIYNDITRRNIILVNGQVKLINLLSTGSGFGDLSASTILKKFDPSFRYQETDRREIRNSDRISRAMFSLGLTIIEFLTKSYTTICGDFYRCLTFFPDKTIDLYPFDRKINLLLLYLFGPADQRPRRFSDLPKLISDFETKPITVSK